MSWLFVLGAAATGATERCHLLEHRGLGSVPVRRQSTVQGGAVGLELGVLGGDWSEGLICCWSTSHAAALSCCT